MHRLTSRHTNAPCTPTNSFAAIVPPLTAPRHAAVAAAFAELDGEHADALDFEDIALRYHAAGHPEVRIIRPFGPYSALSSPYLAPI